MEFLSRKEFEVTLDGYIIVPLDVQMNIDCKIRADSLGKLNNSIRKGSGNLAGYLGQDAFVKSIVGSIHSDTYDYDILCNNYRIEVKTKDRTVTPKPFYECSISEYNYTQQTDYYAFVSLLRDKGKKYYSTAYILGYISSDDYFYHARYLREGDFDPSNRFTVKTNCYNLPINKLTPIKRVV